MAEVPCPSCRMNLLVPVGHQAPTYECPFCRAIVPLAGAPSGAGAAERPIARAERGPVQRHLPIPVFVYVIIGLALAAGGFAALVLMVHHARIGAARATAINHMKQLTLGCVAYHDTHKHLPTPKHIPSKDGTPVELSWRVTILEYVEAMPLFHRFDRNEAWDSPTNLPLLDHPPSIYFDPQLQLEPVKEPALAPSTATHFQYFTGTETAFPDNDQVAIGMSLHKTNFLLAEAAVAVPWTKPADIVVEPKQALPLPPGTFLAARPDVTVQVIDRAKVSDEALRWYLRPNDGPAPALD